MKDSAPFAMVRDITGRMGSEEALRQSEQRYRLLLDSITDYVYRVDVRDGRPCATTHTPGCKAITGYTTEEYAADPDLWFRMIHEQDRTLVTSHIDRVLAGDTVQPLEHRLYHKNGSVRWIRNTIVAERDSLGRMIAYDGMISDITENRRALDALNEERRRLEFILSITKTGIDIIDAGYNLHYVDPGWQATYGDPAGRKCYEYFMGLPEPCPQCAIPRALATQQIIVSEETLVKENNRIVEVHTIPFQDGEGRWLVAEFNVDITERKRAHDMLAESLVKLGETTARYEALIAASNTGAWEYHHDSGFIWCSPEYLSMLGRSLDEFDLSGTHSIEQLWIDLIHPEDREGAHRHFEAYLRNQEGMYEQTFRMRHREGRWVWILSRGKTLRDGEGNPIAITVGTHIDITRRKQAEDSLREMQDLLHIAVDQSPAGILIADAPDVRIRIANPAALNIRQDSAENLSGIAMDTHSLRWQVFYPDGTPVPADQLPLSLAVARGSITLNQELIIRDTLGVDHWVLVNAAPVRDSRGNISAGMVLFQDITERKQAEQEKEKLQAQLLQAQKMESVGRLAGGVAHDFNNMLNIILGYAELAMDRVDPAQPLHADLQEIQQAARRSADLTRQLLAFARRQTIMPRVLDLNAAVSGMLKMLRRLIGEDITLDWKPAEGLWPVMMDPAQVDQILANLSVNARDAMTGSGPLNLSIHTDNAVVDEVWAGRHAGLEPGEYVVLTVSDTGAGMDRDTLGHLFEPFFTTKEVGQGTGLGLAMVYGIVKQNSGYISVDSEPGHGTTFRIYLPRVRKEVETAAPEHESPEAGGPETVLLAEDEAVILELGRTVLERCGYTVLTAGTPEEALKLAEQHSGPIELLITDVVMPGMNGRELHERIKTVRPDIRTLYMSGYTADSIACHGVVDSDVNFLQKPFSISALTSRVRQALDEP